MDVSDITAGPRVVDESLRRRDDGSIHDVWHINGHLKDAFRVRSFGNTADRKGLTVFGSKRPILSQMTEQDRPGDAPSASAAVSETLRSMRFLDLDPEAMRQPSQPGQVILGDRGENLSSVLQSICSDPALEQTLLSWVRALTPMDAVELGFEHDFAGRVMMYLVESSGARVSALSASDGTLRFLALVAALLSPDSGKLYFFEEFDNGIHPTRLHLLLHPTSFKALREFGWPGNFRQLEMFLSNLITLTMVELVDQADVIEPGDPGQASRPDVVPIPPRVVRDLLRPMELPRAGSAHWIEAHFGIVRPQR